MNDTGTTNGVGNENGAGPKLLTAKEAAERLGKNERSIRRYVQRGKLRAVPMSGTRGQLFDVEDIDALDLDDEDKDDGMSAAAVVREATALVRQSHAQIATLVPMVTDGALRYLAILQAENAAVRARNQALELAWSEMTATNHERELDLLRFKAEERQAEREASRQEALVGMLKGLQPAFLAALSRKPGAPPGSSAPPGAAVAPSPVNPISSDSRDVKHAQLIVFGMIEDLPPIDALVAAKVIDESTAALLMDLRKSTSAAEIAPRLAALLGALDDAKLDALRSVGVLGEVEVSALRVLRRATGVAPGAQ